jgi:hypothetical protein
VLESEKEQTKKKQAKTQFKLNNLQDQTKTKQFEKTKTKTKPSKQTSKPKTNPPKNRYFLSHVDDGINGCNPIQRLLIRSSDNDELAAVAEEIELFSQCG